MYRRNIHGILDVIKNIGVSHYNCNWYFSSVNLEKKMTTELHNKSRLHLFDEISFNRLNFIQISPLAPVLTFVWYLYWLKPEFLMETHTSDLVTTWQSHMTTPGKHWEASALQLSQPGHLNNIVTFSQIAMTLKWNIHVT